VLIFLDDGPSHLKKTFVFVKPCSVLNSPKGAVLVVVQDGRDFRRPDLRVVEVSAPSYQGCLAIRDKKDSLCDRVNFRDFARVHEGICGTTVGGADIESENKLSRGAVVRCACHSWITSM
jgi:hypothetical protein